MVRFLFPLLSIAGLGFAEGSAVSRPAQTACDEGVQVCAEDRGQRGSAVL